MLAKWIAKKLKQNEYTGSIVKISNKWGNFILRCPVCNSDISDADEVYYDYLNKRTICKDCSRSHIKKEFENATKKRKIAKND